MRYAARIASKVLPVAMKREVTTVPAVNTLTTKAPIKIAGINRNPKINNAAMAIPVGAQIALALGLTKARERPSLPAIM